MSNSSGSRDGARNLFALIGEDSMEMKPYRSKFEMYNYDEVGWALIRRKVEFQGILIWWINFVKISPNHQNLWAEMSAIRTSKIKASWTPQIKTLLSLRGPEKDKPKLRSLKNLPKSIIVSVLLQANACHTIAIAFYLLFLVHPSAVLIALILNRTCLIKFPICAIAKKLTVSNYIASVWQMVSFVL